MSRKKYDGVYVDDKGIYWAYYNGKKRSANRQCVAWKVYHELQDEDDRAQIATGTSPLSHSEIIILRGVPGCGKTTWAKEWIAAHPWYKRINRDSLRQMFDFGCYTANHEKFIKKTRDELIRECLESGHSVVVDDTNLSKRDIYQITEAAHVFNHVIGISRMVAIPVRIVDFDTPLEECIRRDALREKPVGADRILVMWYKCHKVNSEAEYDRLRAAEARLEEQDR